MPSDQRHSSEYRSLLSSLDVLAFLVYVTIILAIISQDVRFWLHAVWTEITTGQESPYWQELERPNAH